VTVLTLQQNITLINNRCLGDVKCALNMVANNLNNFHSFSLSLSAGGDCILSLISLECEFTLFKETFRTSCTYSVDLLHLI